MCRFCIELVVFLKFFTLFCPNIFSLPPKKSTLTNVHNEKENRLLNKITLYEYRVLNYYDAFSSPVEHCTDRFMTTKFEEL